MRKAMVLLTILFVGGSVLASGQSEAVVGGQPLPIPPLLEGETLNLVMQEGELTLPMGTSETMSFNGTIWGRPFGFQTETMKQSM